MSLTAGTRLGAYEIVGLLGAGGMGEVYRARDARLHRDVAVKVLPPAFAADPERMARFEQEARAAAGLNHPNILAVHDLGQHDGSPFIVTELLDGMSLREMLRNGPLPARKTIEIGVQIALGLAAAHDKGIVHRDLKPDNVFITGDGRLKILDFGLAKLTQPETGAVGMTVMATTPALTAMPNTVAGVVLGTMGYMAPEQVRGVAADHRSDIFALGVVLHEVLSGQRTFRGDTAADVMSGILKEDPPELPVAERHIPPALARIVNRCLEKSPAARFQSARDLAFALDALTSASGSTTSLADVIPVAGAGRKVPVWLMAGAAIVAGIVAGTGVWLAMRSSAVADGVVAKLALALPAADTLFQPEVLNFDIARDGRTVVYVAVRDGTPQLFVRPMTSTVAQLLQGTEGASAPVFSPDARSVAFFARGKLRTIGIASSEIRDLADAPSGRGAWWGEDGVLYFSPTNLAAIQRVSATGGPVTAATTLARDQGEVSHRWPQLLPGGKGLVFTAWTGPARDNHRVELLQLETNQRVTIAAGGVTGRYVPSGHVLYGRLDALMAVPFDLERLTVTGEAFRTGESVRIGSEGALYASSNRGDLVTLPGDPHRLDARLVWVDRSGGIEPLPTVTQDVANTIVAPDGRSAAFNLQAATDEIAVVDFERGTVTALTKATNGSQAPVWSPDGRRIAYRGTRKGFRNVYAKAVDGLEEEQQLTKGDHIQTPQSWSPDGNHLIYYDIDPVTGSDLWLLSLADGSSRPLIRTPANDNEGQWSPDGHWIAYSIEEAGRSEIYVGQYPEMNRRWRVSTDGGREPAWSPDGREIFYRSGADVMAVSVHTTPNFGSDPPRRLFEDRFVPSPNTFTGYSLSRDGKRFLFAQRLQADPPPTQLNVVVNWFTELRRAAAARPQ